MDGETLAVIGGIIEPGETAEQAARRELLEEMQLETSDLVFLGRYRTDVNRGMGWCSCFVARGCVASKKFKASDDLEKQTVVRYSARALRDMLFRGAFKEVKWANTVAMGLLLAEGKS